MSKRFGKVRVLGCTCTYHFTCGACLRSAPSPLFNGQPIPREPTSRNADKTDGYDRDDLGESPDY